MKSSRWLNIPNESHHSVIMVAFMKRRVNRSIGFKRAMCSFREIMRNMLRGGLWIRSINVDFQYKCCQSRTWFEILVIDEWCYRCPIHRQYMQEMTWIGPLPIQTLRQICDFNDVIYLICVIKRLRRFVARCNPGEQDIITILVIMLHISKAYWLMH